jgi:hypothetical protein
VIVWIKSLSWPTISEIDHDRGNFLRLKSSNSEQRGIRMRPIGLIMIASLLILTSCVTSFEGDSRKEDPDDVSHTMNLYRVDIDKAAVANGARLLFMEPPPRSESGYQRRAQGFFSVSDAGFCRVDVGCAEGVVGLSGSRGEQIYSMLKFFGRISDDGERATTTSGETANVRSTRAADEVRFNARGKNKVTIQAVIDGKPQAYLFHFERSPIGSKNVRVPWH